MKRAQGLRYPFLLIFGSGLALAGCQMPAATSSPPAADALAQPPAAMAPEDVSLFGEHPDAESVPYENRLLTNLSRHTFSSVGRDFDPDLHDEDQTLVFASTRNCEHPDIFLKRVDGFAVTQLTSDPADDIQPRFSPDGQKIVFCSNRTDNWDIWLVNRDGTGLTQLTSDGTDEVAPCWSPDGTQIAFTAWNRRSHQWQLSLLALDQPGLRRFLCYGMFPHWSPDGQYIAFQRARQRGTRWFSIWAIELVDGQARHPTELAYSDSTACIAPHWSPDGKSIVYCAVHQAGVTSDSPEPVSADLWTVDVQTGVRLKITDGASSAYNPTWSGTGRIYFVSARSGAENIWSLKTGLETYPVGHRPGRDPLLSRAAANTPVKATTE
jgi:TolB protein